jgi:hypothetical protein
LSTKIAPTLNVFSRKQNSASATTFSQKWKDDCDGISFDFPVFSAIFVYFEVLQEQCHYLLDLSGFGDLT